MPGTCTNDVSLMDLGRSLPLCDAPTPTASAQSATGVHHALTLDSLLTVGVKVLYVALLGGALVRVFWQKADVVPLPTTVGGHGPTSHAHGTLHRAHSHTHAPTTSSQLPRSVSLGGRVRLRDSCCER
jgi:hypothetical protein